MHILVSGGTGFIGEALLPALIQGGNRVTVLSRQRIADTALVRYIRSLDELPANIAVDAIINLAGASLAHRRWTESYKREIVNSRLQITGAIVDWIEQREQRPRLLLSASAIGYYGWHDDEVLGEDAACTPGFAHHLCQEWEEQAMRADQLGVRTCVMRLGVVLDSSGGAYKQMAMPFKIGVGNWIGDGHQWLSWIHREDAVRAVLFLLQREELAGPFNLTAPEPVTGRGFCDAMRAQHKTLLSVPVPAPLMRLMLGEMADELLIHGQRVVPAALLDAGFSFRYPRLAAALRAIQEA